MPTQRRCRLFLVTFSVLTAFATVTTPNSVQADEPRIFEQRIYIANDGKLDALNSRFRDHTCKLFKKHGMELIGFWVPTEGDAAKNTLIYILAYPNKEAWH